MALGQEVKHTVKPFYSPPSLVSRQALAAFCLAALTKWRYFPFWATKAWKTLPVAAGAVGMGCIGFPNHPVWEMTAACNLRCKHCHAQGGKRSPVELSTEEGKKLLRELAAVDSFRMMVFTGGEPLLRPDLFELCAYARDLGFSVVIATNGTLITPPVAKKLRQAGVSCLAISLDAAGPKIHDALRGVPGAYQAAIRALEACREAGMALQVNMTAMESNWEEIPHVFSLVSSYGAEIMLLYQLIPLGRGEEIREKALVREKNRLLVEQLAASQTKSHTIIEPVGAPQYWPYLVKNNGLRGKALRALGNYVFQGCAAGWGLCYVKPDGEVWPCPFVPVSGGNVRQQPFREIWEEGEVFKKLKRREKYLEGKCGACRYNRICGGCRGKAFAHTGNYLAEDPSCFLK